MEAEAARLRVDLLGQIRANLSGLQGVRAMLCELLQNADDSKTGLGSPASSFVIDVRDDALLVENDGIFSDCHEPLNHDCAWVSALHHMCDFHRFLTIAGGDKRNEAGKTGMFGIGFTTVYQFTDAPVLESGVKSVLIEPAKDGLVTSRSMAPFDGTRFIFPWAFEDSSAMRRSLAGFRVEPHRPETFCEEARTLLPELILFLRNIRSIRLLRNGNEVDSVDLIRENDSLAVRSSDRYSRFLLLERVDFPISAEFSALDKPPRIAVAVPLDEAVGQIYCTLPTEAYTNLGFHINADFFPDNNRKAIAFDLAYPQGRWNDFLLRKAGELVAEHAELLAQRLPQELFWRIVNLAQELARGKPDTSRAAAFWKQFQSILRVAQCVLTRAKDLVPPTHVRLARADANENILLERLGIPLCHEDLAAYRNALSACGVPEVDLFELLEVIRAKAPAAGTDRVDGPRWLLEDSALLEALLDKLLQQNRSPARADQARDRLRSSLKSIPLAVDLTDCFQPLGELNYTSSHEFLRALRRLTAASSFFSLSRRQAFASYCESVSIDRVVALLSRDLDELATNAMRYQHDVRFILARLADPKDQKLIQRLIPALRNLPMLRCTDRRIRAMKGCWLSSGFTDPLGLAYIIDERGLDKNIIAFLRTCQVKNLELEAYVKRDIVPILAAPLDGDLETKCWSFLGEHQDTISDDETVRDALANEAQILCLDLQRRSPQDVCIESHLSRALLGDRGPLAKHLPLDNAKYNRLLSRIGVHALPTPTMISERLDELTAESPSVIGAGTIQAFATNLATLAQRSSNDTEQELVQTLRTKAWLLRSGDDESWYKPDALVLTKFRTLFSSQGHFLAFDDETQSKTAEFLERIGVRTEPYTSEVVRHLLYLAESGNPPATEVYAFLQDRLQSDPSDIAVLQDQACLYVDVAETRRYLRPDQVLWQHPFGPFRVALDQSWHRFRELIGYLGVPDEPTWRDASAVLQEIALDHGIAEIIAPDTLHVVDNCWRLISQSVTDARLPEEDRTAAELDLERTLLCVPCVRTPSGHLRAPSVVYFKNRPHLTEAFGHQLRPFLIPVDPKLRYGLQAAGVQRLSDMVSTEIAVSGEARTERVATILHDRSLAVRRVILATGEQSIIEKYELWQHSGSARTVNDLRVRYFFPPEGVLSPWQAQGCAAKDLVLFIDEERAGPEEVGRELASLLDADDRAAHFCTIIQATSLDDAQRKLDDLGVDVIEEAPSQEVAMLIGRHLEVSATAPVFEANAGTTDGLAEIGDIDFEPLPALANEQPVNVVSRSGTQRAYGDVALDESETPPENDVQSDAAERSLDEPVIKAPDDEAKRRLHRSTLPISTSATSIRSHSTEPRSKGGNDRSHGISRFPRGRRLVSYVMEGGLSKSASLTEAAHRARVERAAIRRVLAYENAQGREPLEMPPLNPGFDIESRHGDEIRYIEVKGLASDWSDLGVVLTRTEFETANRLGRSWWLYVVEYALEDDGAVIELQGIANRVTHFAFDRGWVAVAEAGDEKARTPVAGCRVKFDNGVTGVVTAVSSHGLLHRITVRDEAGKVAQRLFNPATMSLQFDEG